MPNQAKAVRPLWTCPKCGVKLVTRNLWHSCGRATVVEWRARMTPQARRLYDGFEGLVANCGEYHVSPAKTRIAFLARIRFCGLVGILPTGITISFALPQPLHSRRIDKVVEIVPGWWAHRLQITEKKQLDQQLQGWIRKSYRLMGMRGWKQRRTRHEK